MAKVFIGYDYWNADVFLDDIKIGRYSSLLAKGMEIAYKSMGVEVNTYHPDPTFLLDGHNGAKIKAYPTRFNADGSVKVWGFNYGMDTINTMNVWKSMTPEQISDWFYELMLRDSVSFPILFDDVYWDCSWVKSLISQILGCFLLEKTYEKPNCETDNIAARLEKGIELLYDRCDTDDEDDKKVRRRLAEAIMPELSKYKQYLKGK